MAGLARPGVPDPCQIIPPPNRFALRSSISLPASQLSRDHLATALADGLREITARLLPPTPQALQPPRRQTQDVQLRRRIREGTRRWLSRRRCTARC